MTGKKIIALVPLKSNSERVPGKNFRDLLGKPLFAWILDTLLEIQEIDQIIVNTDARERLLQLGFKKSHRLNIRDRKSELCGDLVSMNLILADDIVHSDGDVYLMTHVTNPFLSAHTIQRGIATFAEYESQYDSLFSVNKFHSRFYLENGQPLNHSPGNLIRTQDLPPLYEENSCLYLFTKSSFTATNARIGKKPLLFPTPPLESIDIDIADDWTMAEALAGHLAVEARAR